MYLGGASTISTKLQRSSRTITRIISVVAVFLTLTGSAAADQFDDQIATLKQQAADQANQAAQLHSQADDYRSKVAELQAQINTLQTQINLNTAEFNKVSSAIAENKVRLDQQKTVLAANIKS